MFLVDARLACRALKKGVGVSLDIPNLVGSLIAVVVSLVAYKAALDQNRLSASSVGADWIRDLRGWASEAVDVLAEASYSCAGAEAHVHPPASAHQEYRSKLSALIDRGRFLLPNERDDEYGSHKPRAYRGLRHPALDALVAAEQVLGRSIPLEAFPDSKEALIGLRREFVSIVQGIIDPQSHNHDVARILRLASDKRAKDPTLGGLLSDGMSLPTGAAGIMEAASRRYRSSRPGSHTRARGTAATAGEEAGSAPVGEV